MKIRFIFIFLSLFIYKNLLATTKEIIIYTSKTYKGQPDIHKKFYDKTGILITPVASSSEKLMEKLGNVKLRKKADLIIFSEMASMQKAKQLGYFDVILEDDIYTRLPDVLKDKNKVIIPFMMNPRILVYNKAVSKSAEKFNYSDITNETFAEKITQRTFQNKYNKELVTYMIKIYGVPKTKNLLEEISNNLIESPIGNDRYQLRKVAKKEALATFVNLSDFALMSNSKNQIEKNLSYQLKIANKGDRTYASVSSVALLKTSKNKEYALQYIKFLLDEKTQKYIADNNFEYPVNQNVEISDFVKNLNLPGIVTLDFKDYPEYHKQGESIIVNIEKLQ